MAQHKTNLMGAAGEPIPRVVVVYENPAVREHAAQCCERLLVPHLANVVLEFNWWSFEFLADQATAGAAAETAARADLIIFAVPAGGDFPAEIKLWIERWLNRRAECEGALVGLILQESQLSPVTSLKEIYLRNIAHRGGMDYLSQVPPAIPKCMPDSLDSFTNRAGQMTSVLDEMLHRRWLPPIV